MRTLRAVAVAAGIAVAVALAGAPAGAKGPRSATVDGPGLDAPIDHPDAGSSKLPALTGLVGPLWGDTSVPLLDAPPTDDLGPAYVLTWDLGEYLDGTGSPDRVRQTVHPYAAGSPLVHTEAGQPFYAEETSGGWYVAPQALRYMLISLGLPTTDPPASGSGRGWVFPAVLAAVAAVALAFAGLVLRRTTTPLAYAV